jgi:hypothetical protein
MLFQRTLLVLALLALPVIGQTAAKLKQELKTKETAAKKDPEAIFEVGKWAAEKALADDAKRLFQSVLKLKPDHAGANEAVGNQLVEGKWIPAKEAEALRKKAQAAEFAAKGLVEVGGVWVEKDKVDDARKGIFHHEGDVVTKDEFAAFNAGKVRHPETGEFIDAKNLEKAQNKYYPIGNEGRWVDEKEADTYHSEVKRPWVVRTGKGTILSTLPLAKIRELTTEVDQGIERVMPLLGVTQIAPARRPVILVAATQSEYQDYGSQMGDGTDAAGAFFAKEANVQIPHVGSMRIAVCDNHKDWGTRYVRHAAALAAAQAVAAEAGADLPLWLEHAFGSATSRFQNESDAGWVGKQFLGRGGVGNVKAWFASFAINGEMQATEVANNIYMAGLLLTFAASGKDEKCTEALKAITAMLSGGGKGNVDKALDKAVAKLQAALIEAQPQLVAHLQHLITKAPPG